MAAPILNVATQIPSELTAPIPVVVNKAASTSNQAFKAELNRAHESAKPSQSSTAEQAANSVANNPSKVPQNTRQTSSGADNSEQASSQNQAIDKPPSAVNRETTAVDATIQQGSEQAQQESLNAALALDNGKPLPSAGETLPLVTEFNSLISQQLAPAAQVSADSEVIAATAALTENSNAKNNISVQGPIQTAEVVATPPSLSGDNTTAPLQSVDRTTAVNNTTATNSPGTVPIQTEPVVEPKGNVSPSIDYAAKAEFNAQNITPVVPAPNVDNVAANGNSPLVQTSPVQTPNSNSLPPVPGSGLNDKSVRVSEPLVTKPNSNTLTQPVQPVIAELQNVESSVASVAQSVERSASPSSVSSAVEPLKNEAATPLPTPNAINPAVITSDIVDRTGNFAEQKVTPSESINSQINAAVENLKNTTDKQVITDKLAVQAPTESVVQHEQTNSSIPAKPVEVKPLVAKAELSVQSAPSLKQGDSVVNVLPQTDTVKQPLNTAANPDSGLIPKDNSINLAAQQKATQPIGAGKSASPENASVNSESVRPALINAAPAPAPLAVNSLSVNANQSEQSISLNQYLEKMRSGVESSTTEKVLEESASTKVSSEKVTESLLHLNSMQNNLRTTNPVQMQMPAGTPPTARNWSSAVADKVFIAASQNLRVANIQLDPPELGALQIRLQISGPDQQLSASFTSPHAAVRDALEQQLPRLREMLAEQGISLGESSVNDHGSQSERGANLDNQQGGAGFVDSEEGDLPVNPLNTQGTVSLVDFYA